MPSPQQQLPKHLLRLLPLAWCRLGTRRARTWRHKDGHSLSITVKTPGETAVCRLVRRKSVLYGYGRSLHGNLWC
jgi:hypothetical protein